MNPRLAVLVLSLLTSLASAELRVDCAKSPGPIRPLHGGNCGPLQSGGMIDLSAYFREMRMPLTRFHDCHWPNPDVVDIHAVFPDFRADPARPESYDFARTDEYVEATLKTGSKIVYRLGQSIEHTKLKRHVHPPADYDKWAQVCLGIIAHYNDAWAKGSRADIRYWEIWNEPENRPTMWSGSDEDYFRLYEVASRAIKAKYPDLKVGGPSLGYTGKLAGGRFEPGEFLMKFLRHCRDRKLPLDFFSWHLYTNDPAESLVRARGIRAVLDAHGFEKAEMHLNEWNYLPGNDWGPMSLKGQGAAREKFYGQIQGAPGAAFLTCVLSNLQDSRVDVGNYFMSDNQGFGLFNCHGTPQKNFYAMKAFGTLLDTPVRLQSSGGDASGLTILAGMDEGKSALNLLIGNFKSNDPVEIALENLPWNNAAGEVLVIDGARSLERTGEVKLSGPSTRVKLELSAPAVVLIKIRPTR